MENFEDALLTSILEERNALMNFVIVEGGPTGVELTGALAEMKIGILLKDYPYLDIRKMQINIIHSGRLLKAMSEKASGKAENILTKLGVNIYKYTHVINYDGYNVETDTELSFLSCTVIWAAGVSGSVIEGVDVKCVIERSERIKVDEFNKVIGYKNIFAIGNVACMDAKELPNGHPMLAQPAIQPSKHLAKIKLLS